MINVEQSWQICIWNFSSYLISRHASPTKHITASHRAEAQNMNQLFKVNSYNLRDKAYMQSSTHLFFFFKPGASLWKRVILLLIAITNWDLIKRQLGLAYFRKGLIKKQKKRKSTQCNKQEIIPCSSLHLWLQALAVICNTAHDPRESWRCMPIHFFPL